MIRSDSYTFTFVNVTAANTAPTTCTKNLILQSTADTPMTIAGADRISVSVDTLTDTNHTATDYDINFIASNDPAGTIYDDGTTNIYATQNYTAVDMKATFNVTTGPYLLKLRVDENAALRADGSVYVTVTWDD